jgi:hypothetical protein
VADPCFWKFKLECTPTYELFPLDDKGSGIFDKVDFVLLIEENVDDAI